MYYSGKTVVLTTKHEKLKIISSPFLENLNLQVMIAALDTDALGTFSGEKERPGSALEVIEKKCRMGMQATGMKLGLASEGSFGPHPLIPFIPSNYEMMMFVDDEIGFKLCETLLTSTTNYQQLATGSWEDILNFSKSLKFPSHGLIVRPNNWQDKRIIFKGITSESALRKAFEEAKALSEDGLVWLETDMRAHMNPMRMEVIGQLAHKLSSRLACTCPKCGAPGWGKVRTEPGLPCEFCNTPTDMNLREIFGCVLCDYEESKPREDGKTQAEQRYCPECNP
jgi:hypothetical protein